MSVPHHHFIAGRRSTSGSEFFNAIEAAAGRALAPAFADATAAEIAGACREAELAADPYARIPLENRARFLESIAEKLEGQSERMVQRACSETGLSDVRLRGELKRTTGQLRLFANAVRAGDFLGVRIDRGDEGREPAPKPDIRQYKIPLGPVAVFGASNFPLAFSVCGGDTASALAAGCPVLVKAHPSHPGTSALTAEAVECAVRECGMPPGVFSMVHGRSNRVGAALVQHREIRAVGFTGSHAGGTALAKIALERETPIPVYAEMGSVNPMFLLPAALAERANAIARGLMESFTLGCGQFCTNPGLVFAVGGSGMESFVNNLAAQTREHTAGIMLNGSILSAYEEGVQRRELTDGVERVAVGTAKDGRAQVAVHRTSIDRFLAAPDLADEIFGPATLIVETNNAEELVRVAAELPGQLTSAIHAAEKELLNHATLLDILQQRAGRVLYNGFPTGVEVCHAMVHGGPYPATTDLRTTSVGTAAMDRFLRPVCLQDVPAAALPAPLREANPLGVRRLVDGVWEGPAS